jgi:RNA polymerase sigma factor (sigma-70 family)
MERAIVERWGSDPLFYAHLRTYARRKLHEWPPEWGGAVNRRAEEAVNEAFLIALESDGTPFRNNPNAPTRWFEVVIDNVLRDRGRKETRTKRILAAMAAWVIKEEQEQVSQRKAPSVSNEDVLVDFSSGKAQVTGGEQHVAMRETKGGVHIRLPDDPLTITVRLYPMVEPSHVKLQTQEEAVEAHELEAKVEASRPPGTTDEDWQLLRLSDSGLMTTRELADRTGRSQSDVSRTVRRLRQKRRKTEN